MKCVCIALNPLKCTLLSVWIRNSEARGASHPERQWQCNIFKLARNNKISAPTINLVRWPVRLMFVEMKFLIHVCISSILWLIVLTSIRFEFQLVSPAVLQVHMLFSTGFRVYLNFFRAEFANLNWIWMCLFALHAWLLYSISIEWKLNHYFNSSRCRALLGECTCKYYMSISWKCNKILRRRSNGNVIAMACGEHDIVMDTCPNQIYITKIFSAPSSQLLTGKQNIDSLDEYNKNSLNSKKNREIACKVSKLHRCLGDFFLLEIRASSSIFNFLRVLRRSLSWTTRKNERQCLELHLTVRHSPPRTFPYNDYYDLL